MAAGNKQDHHTDDSECAQYYLKPEIGFALEQIGEDAESHVSVAIFSFIAKAIGCTDYRRPAETYNRSLIYIERVSIEDIPDNDLSKE